MIRPHFNDSLLQVRSKLKGCPRMKKYVSITTQMLVCIAIVTMLTASGGADSSSQDKPRGPTLDPLGASYIFESDRFSDWLGCSAVKALVFVARLFCAPGTQGRNIPSRNSDNYRVASLRQSSGLRPRYTARKRSVSLVQKAAPINKLSSLKS
jgi:hypothetical protein